MTVVTETSLRPGGHDHRKWCFSAPNPSCGQRVCTPCKGSLSVTLIAHNQLGLCCQAVTCVPTTPGRVQSVHQSNNDCTGGTDVTSTCPNFQQSSTFGIFTAMSSRAPCSTHNTPPSTTLCQSLVILFGVEVFKPSLPTIVMPNVLDTLQRYRQNFILKLLRKLPPPGYFANEV